MNDTNTNRPVALITGGSRGIGFGCAQHLAANGFDLAINGLRNENEITSALNDLRNKKNDVLYCQGDIGKQQDRDRIIEQTRQRFGKLNVLVNNAGIAPKKRIDILETTEENFDHVIQVNLKGAYFLSQSVAKWLIEQKKENNNFQGSIINISSVSATVASTNRGEYCIAKAALSMTTQLFAARLGEFHLPVYEIRPGITKTDMTTAVSEKYDKLIADGLCVTPRWGFPDDVGKAVASLARGDFPYSTGQAINIDGGMTLQRL